MSRHRWWHPVNLVVTRSVVVAGGWEVVTHVACPRCGRDWLEYHELSSADVDIEMYGRLT